MITQGKAGQARDKSAAVRAQADTNAGQSAAPLDALAYTVGEHIGEDEAWDR